MFVLIMFFSNSVYSIGLAPSVHKMEVQPNNKYIVNYHVTGVGNYEVIIGSHELLEQYIEVKKLESTGIGHKFQVIFDFPRDIEKQGHEIISIMVKEKPIHATSKGQSVSGLTAVEGRIHIDIPYEGLYAEMFTEIYNANKGEEVEIDVTIKNFGQVNINKAYTKIKIYKDDEKIKTLKSEKVAIPVGSSHEFVHYLSTEDLNPGIYNAEITGYYDSKERETETIFKIGTLDILITEFTKELYINETNEMKIKLESLWNNNIEKVFADIIISKDGEIIKEIQTPNYDLRAWDSREIVSYIDTTGWELGEYDIQIILHFEDTTKTIKDEILVVRKPDAEMPFNIFGLTGKSLILISSIVIVTLIMIVINIILVINIFKDRNIKKGKRIPKKKIKKKNKKNKKYLFTIKIPLKLKNKKK